MKHIFFSLLSALAFSACQNTEPAKPRSLDCYVRFLEPESQIRAEATLKEGDTAPLTLKIPEGIRYQGKEMKSLSSQGASYRWDDSGEFAPKHVFSWKDEKGEVRQFEMQLSPLKNFGFEPKPLSRQQTAIMRWEGEPLSKGETIVFMWENAATGKTLPMEIYNNTGVPAIEFPAAKVAELDPGIWTYYLVRKKLTKADVNGVAASGIIEYYTKSDTVEVK
jgi:hypothetical protein